MWCKVSPLFWAIGFMFFINLPSLAQNLPEKNEDYKKWSLEQLLFSIDSGLLDEETRLEYIEFYLQKAKKENSTDEIVIGYKKKVANLKDYDVKTIYADSLIDLAHHLNDKKVLGVAYDYKSYVEYVAKNYKNALKYGLEAENFLKATNDLYSLNSVKNSIGSIYYHLEEYPKAYKFFTETTTYYKEKSDRSYNDKRSYINNLFGLSKSAYHLQKYDTLQVIIKDGYKGIQELKTHHQPLETAYFSLLDGMYHYTLQEYSPSDSLLQAALPQIKKNSDFANEHLTYLYLGKNAWKTGKKEQALGYFKKVDSLYQNKDFINSELSEAYTYLVNYYKEEDDTEKQLAYTSTLLDISHQLQTQNKDLSDYLHKNMEAKKLEASKAQLEKEIKNNQLWRKGLYGVSGVLVVLVIIGLVYGNKKPKEQISNISEQPVNKPVAEDKIIAPKILSTEEILLEKLAKFEAEKGFLQKITLRDLAYNLSTNRTTLSQVLNEHKGGFKVYLKKLRIDYAVTEIEQDPKLKELNFDALAEEFGFGSGKSFSAAFKEITDTNLMDFIRLNKQQVVS